MDLVIGTGTIVIAALLALLGLTYSNPPRETRAVKQHIHHADGEIRSRSRGRRF